MYILDEPTAMLDPSGRKEVMNTIKKLNKEENKDYSSYYSLYG
jgi:energy-coupling factor transport system ATP-binding protein